MSIKAVACRTVTASAIVVAILICPAASQLRALKAEFRTARGGWVLSGFAAVDTGGPVPIFYILRGAAETSIGQRESHPRTVSTAGLASLTSFPVARKEVAISATGALLVLRASASN
eukprot:3342058-Rhodomonas_salina.1